MKTQQEEMTPIQKLVLDTIDSLRDTRRLCEGGDFDLATAEVYRNLLHNQEIILTVLMLISKKVDA